MITTQFVTDKKLVKVAFTLRLSPTPDEHWILAPVECEGRFDGLLFGALFQPEKVSQLTFLLQNWV